MLELWQPNIPNPLAHVIEFFVPGRPTGWQRPTPPPGAGFRPPIDTEKNRKYKALIRSRFTHAALKKDLLGVFPWKGPAVLQVISLFFVKGLYPGRQLLHPPDVSNLLKLPEDSLFMPGRLKPRMYKGRLRKPRMEAGEDEVIWALKDDAQIIHSTSTKLPWKSHGQICILYLLEEMFPAREPSKKRGRKKQAHRPWIGRYGGIDEEDL